MQTEIFNFFLLLIRCNLDTVILYICIGCRSPKKQVHMNMRMRQQIHQIKLETLLVFFKRLECLDTKSCVHLLIFSHC